MLRTDQLQINKNGPLAVNESPYLHVLSTMSPSRSNSNFNHHVLVAKDRQVMNVNTEPPVGGLENMNESSCIHEFVQNAKAMSRGGIDANSFA